jgi:hypothetical protein
MPEEQITGQPPQGKFSGDIAVTHDVTGLAKKSSSQVDMSKSEMAATAKSVEGGMGGTIQSKKWTSGKTPKYGRVV